MSRPKTFAACRQAGVLLRSANHQVHSVAVFPAILPWRLGAVLGASYSARLGVAVAQAALVAPPSRHSVTREHHFHRWHGRLLARRFVGGWLADCAKPLGCCRCGFRRVTVDLLVDSAHCTCNDTVYVWRARGCVQACQFCWQRSL